MSLSEAEINEKIQEEGAIRILATFEVAGKPKKHVEDTLTTYVDKLQEDKSVTVLDTHRGDAIELEDEDNKGFFSAFAEVEMLLKDAEDLIHLSINLMPASIEVLAPDRFEFEAREMQGWTNDLLSRLHEISQSIRAEKQKVAYLNKNTRALVQNLITVLLLNGPKTTEQITRMSGVEQKNITRILESLSEKDVVSQEGEKWVLNKQAK